MDHTRHMNLFNITAIPFAVIGAGGIGATTCLTLAKMGAHEIFVADPDKVEPVNLSTQLHRVDAVGRYKVLSVSDVCKEFSDEIDVYPWNFVIDPTSEIPGEIIISAVDSINARKDIWEAVKKSKAEWYIEARMAAEQLQVHVVDMNLYSWYGNYISGQREEDYPEESCTSKATFYTAMIAGGVIGSVVKTLVMDDHVDYHKLIYNIRTQEIMKA